MAFEWKLPPVWFVDTNFPWKWRTRWTLTMIRCANNHFHDIWVVKYWERHHTHSAGEKDRAYFNGLSCCQNVWYALATDSSGIAGSTVCVCMRVYACEQAHNHTHTATKHTVRRQTGKESYSTLKSLITCCWEDPPSECWRAGGLNKMFSSFHVALTSD